MLFLNRDGTAKSWQLIADQTGGGPDLATGDDFGDSVASVGDLDGDGVTDLAVGAGLDDTGGENRGAVYVLLMNSNGTAKAAKKIAHQTAGGPTLANSDFFGSSVTSLGDLNGDGLIELAVGASGDDTGGSGRGAVHVLALRALPPTLSVSLPAGGVSEAAGAAAGTGTVTRSGGDLPGPLTVTLTSSDTSEATVPATVTIPADQDSVTFPITAVDDALLDGTQTVTITASAHGCLSGAQTLAVTDYETLSVGIVPQWISENGGTATATVTRSNTDIGSAVTVSLAASPASAASVPATVTIPANKSSATFTVTAVDDARWTARRWRRSPPRQRAM